MENTKWNGRLEVVSKKPTFVVDGAHNIHGANALKDTIINSFKFNKLILGIGMLGDKDVDGVVKLLAPLADKIIVTQPKGPRALTANELSKKIKNYNDNIVIKEEVKDAIDESINISNEDDLIVFSGSLYLIGEVRTIVKSKKN